MNKQVPDDAPAWAKQPGRQIVPAEHAPRLELRCGSSYSGIRLMERDNDEAYIQMDADDWVEVEDY
jgi:hypothetical protein